MPNIQNKWNYYIGYEFHIFENEKGFVIENMYKDDIRKSLFLTCRCLECGKLKNIRANSITQQPGSLSHKYCNLISKGIGNEYNDDKVYYDKVRMAFYSAHNRCENPNYPCYNRYNGRNIIVGQEFSKTDDGLRNWLNYMIPMLKDRVNLGINNGEFLDIKDALSKLSVDRIDDNSNYEYGNLRWVTPDIQIQNRNCMNNFFAISPDGKIYISNNRTKFANEFGLHPTHVAACVSGYNNRQSTSGWRFFKQDQLFYFDYKNPACNIIEKMY